MKTYYVQLIDRVWFCLICFEQDTERFIPYTKTLAFELSGDDEFKEIKRVRNLLNALTKEENELDHALVKKTIMKCTSLIDLILSNWEE